MRRETRILISVIVCVAAALSCWASAFAAAGDPAEDTAQQILDRMTLKEKIDQMLIVECPRTKMVKTQKKYQFGGYLLFGENFKNTSKKKFKSKIRSCQKASKVPMLIAVDEEGGPVVRASLYKKFRKYKFRSPREVYRDKGYSGITRYTRLKDNFLKGLGINCNFAPVADVPYEKSDFMYGRAFSTKTGKTVKFIRRTIRQMDEDDVVSVLKHFPGYGGNGDTHGRIIKDKRSLKTFKKRDLKPFAAGIENGADMIMVSHIKVRAFDGKRPASLSKKVHRYLRKDMDFDGVIITDGLAMDGVMDFVGGDEGKAAVRAINAGNDMLCVTGSYRTTYKAIRDAVKGGKIDRARIDRSVKRILKMKIKRGIIQ